MRTRAARRDRLVVLAAFAVLAVALSQTRLVTRLEENPGLAWLYAARGVTPPPEGAAIIALDEGSTSWLQRNSGRLASTAPGLHRCLGEDAAAQLGAMRSANELPRGVIACLIDALATNAPRLLVFDVHFAVAQPQDRTLAAAIRRAGNVLLLERVSEQAPAGGAGPPLLLRRRPVGVLREAALGTVSFLVESAPGHVTTRYVTRLDAFPDLRAMPVEAYRRVSGQVPSLAEREAFWLYGPPRTVRTWSVREVFEPLVTHPLYVRDQVVFIGGSSFGMDASRDSFPVPAFTRALSGVELAATAYLNLHAEQRLRMPDAPGRAAFAGASAIALAAAALFLPRRLAAGCVLLLAAAISGAAVALFHRGIWMPIAGPLLLGLPLTALIALERRVRFARRLTVALLPLSLSKQVLQDGSAAPRTQVASAMFADLAGSTGLAEKYGPEAYTKIMAQYYSTVSDAVDRNGGAVYKYEGDGILALFVGPADQEKHACGALEAARRIAATVSADMAENALPEIGIRIGISTGPVAVGMLRFGGHASVSTMGDAVHRAYRLQEMGRELMQEAGPSGVVTLVDDETVALARPNERQMRFRTTAILRGRSSPTRVYHLAI